VAQKRDQWRLFVSTVINFWISVKSKLFLDWLSNSWFPRRTLLHEISIIITSADIIKVESVQRKFLALCYNRFWPQIHYSYMNILEHLKFLALCTMRPHLLLEAVFLVKMIVNFIQPYSKLFFFPSRNFQRFSSVCCWFFTWELSCR